MKLLLILLLTNALVAKSDVAFSTPGFASSETSSAKSRYSKKPSSGSGKKSQKRKIERMAAAESAVESGAEAESVESLGPKLSPLPTLSSVDTPAQDKAPAVTPDTGDQHSQPAPEANGQKTFGQEVRDLVLGGELESVDKYRTFLDSDDIRKNLYEFTVATGYLYNDSSSSYFFRNYTNASPSTNLGVKLWVTPFFGIDASTRLSILNRTKDSGSQDIFIDSNHTWYDIGFEFRRFFGLSQKASALSVGVRYASYQFSVPPSSYKLLKTESAGPKLDLGLRLYRSANYFWNMGLTVEPFLNHKEVVGGFDSRAGQSNESVGFGLYWGGEFQLSRNSRAFFQLTGKLYRSNFSGSALRADVLTGSTPSGVSVNNTFFLFDIGMKLGN